MGVKVGDKIKLLRDDTFGAYKRGDIVNVRGLVDGGVYFDDNDGDERYAPSEWFESVAVADSNGNQPKFKVGDRVREKADADLDLIGHWDEYWRNTARYDGAFYVTGIIQHGNGGRRVTYSAIPGGEGPQIETKYIEPAPLTIHAGRYYKTRDGRKVGPARDDAGDFDVGGWLYTEDGRFVGADGDYPLDLIAEWTDEPASTPSATTGFTVPLDAPEFGGGAPKFKVGDKVEVVGVGTSPERYLGTQFTIDSDEDDFDGEQAWSGKDHNSPYRFKESQLRLVAEATSGKEDEPDAAAMEFKDGKFFLRASQFIVDDKSPTTIADIVRRLEALEDKVKGGKIKIGGSVTLDAPAKVTGIDKHSVNIVLASGGSYALPLAALRAA